MRQQSWSVWWYLLSWWHVMTWQLWQILWGHIWMSWLSQLYLMNVQLWEIRQSRLWDCAVCVTKRWLIDSSQYSYRYYCLYTSSVVIYIGVVWINYYSYKSLLCKFNNLVIPYFTATLILSIIWWIWFMLIFFHTKLTPTLKICLMVSWYAVYIFVMCNKMIVCKGRVYCS